MKGAYLLSGTPDLADVVLAAMRVAGAQVTPDGVAQRHDEQGRLFTVFAHPVPEPEWRSDPMTPAEQGPRPDLEGLTAVWIECRWDDLFVAEVRALALALPTASWVLDGDGVLWPAGSVDPARVRL